MSINSKRLKGFYVPYLIMWVVLFITLYFFKWKDFPAFFPGIYVSMFDSLLVTLCVFFINTYIIPSYYKTRRYILFVVMFFLLVIGFGLCIIAIHMLLVRSTLLANGEWSAIFINNLVLSSYFTLFFFASLGATIIITLNRIKDQQDYLQLEKEKLRAELKALKNQVNPHFLFNALNTLYYKIDRTNSDARDILLNISDLMRYHIYQSDLDSIPIEQELSFISKYIHLQKERLNPDVKLEMSGFDKVNGFSIIPFLLIPVVENCFKHLAIEDMPEKVIKIIAEADTEWFSFSTINSVNTGYSKNETKVDQGIGLENVKKRLELAYKGNYIFEAKKIDGLFEVQLKLRYHANTDIDS